MTQREGLISDILRQAAAEGQDEWQLRNLQRALEGLDEASLALVERGELGGTLGLAMPASRASPEARPRRGRRGPRPWEKPDFLACLAETKRTTLPPRTLARVAERFRRLDGTIGIEPDSLARLKRPFGG